MNYEKIIVELLSRIQTIEEKIGIASSAEYTEKTVYNDRKKHKMSTAEIKQYIEKFLDSERQAGKDFTELICGILHKQLGLKNAIPMVCNAMKACMKPGDTVVFRSPSGFSATLKIRYCFAKTNGFAKNNAKIEPKIQARSEISAAMTGEAALASKPAPAREAKIDIAAANAKTAISDLPADKQKTTDAKPFLPEMKPPVAKLDLSIAAVWRRILDNEWAIFYLPDGAEFAYIAGNDYLAIVRTNYRLPRADIEKALALYPFKNTVPLQHLRYPSYIYAILTDERIIGSR